MAEQSPLEGGKGGVVYLPEPITLYGIRIGHTYEGLKHLIEHYTATLQHAVAQKKISDKDKIHCEKMIENFKLHVQLYEKHRTESPFEGGNGGVNTSNTNN